MCAVEDRANHGAERPMTIPALPARCFAVSAGVPAYRLTLAVGTNGPPLPAHLFEILDSLLLGLEGLEDLNDVHSARPYSVRLEYRRLRRPSRPKAYHSVNYSNASDPEFSQAWHITNLRPLWKPDNLKKSDQRIYLL